MSAPGCGSCADGCKDRGSCRVRDESPPSATVGVDAMDLAMDAFRAACAEWRKNPDNRDEPEAMHGVRAVVAALAQQPAACVGCEGLPSGENNPCRVCGCAYYTIQQPAADAVTVQQAWEWAGGNPGIKATREDLEQALRDLDAACDEADRQPAAVGVPADVVREYLDARACYEAAIRPPNSHASAPVLRHDNPDALRLRNARRALDSALAQQPAAVDAPEAPGRTLYIDLDGVMADFDGAFPAVFGLDHRSLADDDMWLRINGHASFFRDLPPMAGAIEFFRSVEHLSPVILTACPKSNYPHVAAQKRAWVREHLSATCLVLPVLGGRHKPLFMHQPGDILIDDWGKNCRAWAEAGGVAIKHEGDWSETRAALTAAIAAQPGGSDNDR